MISEFGVEHLRAGEKRGLQKESIKNKEQAIEESTALYKQKSESCTIRSFDEDCVSKGEKKSLADHNIYHTPEYMYVKGSAALSVNIQQLSMWTLNQGIGISGDDLEVVKIVYVPGIK